MQIGINIAVKGAQTSGTSAPVPTVSPVISGNTTIGSTLTLTSVGSYTGTAPITYAYQWYRGVTAIVGQTSTTYITQVADVGLQVICQVQASNAYGSAFASSNYIIPVALFTTTWTTTAPNQTITLPYVPTGIYSGTIDWGDGNTSVNNGTVTTHTYVTSGTYTVVINGNCDGWNFNQIGGSGFITSVEWWGQLKLTVGGTYNLGGYFGSCSNLDISTVSDVLDLIGVTDMSNMFINCTSLTTINRINEWDTSAVVSMGDMFNSCQSFNQPLSFNTAAVQYMSTMFYGCTAFNQPLSFNTAAVNEMSYMFRDCTSFNQPLSFNTAAVQYMNSMFYGCTAFNQPLSFNTSAVDEMSYMFYGATAFNQNIGSWNVANVTNFIYFMQTKSPATFSTTNLDAIYNGWVTVQSSLNISFGTAKYSAAGAAGRAYLTGTKLWTITDGGL